MILIIYIENIDYYDFGELPEIEIVSGVDGEDLCH